MLALSNENLILAIRSLVKEERRITREILEHIGEVANRRIYAELGFSSIFDWLVKDLGYSESAAYRRMQAARVLQAVPEVAGKLESGALGLTVLSKVQTFIRAEEKLTGESITPKQTSEILSKVESCSGREAESRLAKLFPEVAAAPTEKVRAIAEDQISVQVTFTREQFDKLKRIQEILSHSNLSSSHADLLDAAMDVFLEKKDPLKKIVRKRTPPRDTAAEVETGKLKPSQRSELLKKSKGQCEFLDPNTERRCESRHLLEIDHIQPRALGGTNRIDNLRVLCRTHNLLIAERIFGRKKIEAFRS